MALPDKLKSRFSISETFNNKDGKTSGSGFIGVILGLTTAAGFLTGIVGWWLEKPEALDLISKIIQLGVIASSLLGVRKISGNFGKNTDIHKNVG